ncbi:hypothetical protein BJ912DRAFT_986919 [Pholiota molesta]|nr:hypothetical protein BJ912DRAFT_986919 [Pholiota molesta]
MWALALRNVDGRKGEGTQGQGRPESRIPSRCARRATHLAHPLTHIHLPTVSARGDEGRGHHTRPPFFIPSRGHSHRTPWLPRCSPPSPCALPRHRDEAACRTQLFQHRRLPPTRDRLPTLLFEVSRAHQRPSVPMPMPLRLAQPATALVRTTGAVRRLMVGLLLCHHMRWCWVSACSDAGLAQARAAWGDNKQRRREGRHRSLSPLRPLLQGMGRQACACIRALPAVADWNSCGWWEARGADQASPQRASGGTGERECSQGIGEERIIPFQHARLAIQIKCS